VPLEVRVVARWWDGRPDEKQASGAEDAFSIGQQFAIQRIGFGRRWCDAAGVASCGADVPMLKGADFLEAQLASAIVNLERRHGGLPHLGPLATAHGRSCVCSPSVFPGLRQTLLGALAFQDGGEGRCKIDDHALAARAVGADV